MKKLLGILVLGLLWCNVGFAAGKVYPGKNGPVYEGMSKQSFCLQECPTMGFSAFCRSKPKYFRNGIEVNKWKSKYAIFKDVTIPIHYGAWTNCRQDAEDFGNGTFHAIAYSWEEVQQIVNELNKPKIVKTEPKKDLKPKFASKEKQYEHTCGKALGLKKGSKPYMECALKIMEMELELTRINAQKEVALAQAQAAVAQQRSADAQMLQAEAYAQDRKFNQGMSQLMMGLSLLGGGTTSSTSSPSMDSFDCRVRGTGSMKYIDCW